MAPGLLRCAVENPVDPTDGERIAMITATDSALKSPARWFWVCLGLGVCVTDVGCSQLRSYRQGNPPMLGAAAPFSSGVNGAGGDYYAREVAKGVDQNRALLAQRSPRADERGRGSSPAEPESIARSTEHPIAPTDRRTGGEEEPLDVALQGPVTIPVARPAAVDPVAARPMQPKKPVESASASNEPRTELSPATILAASRSRLNALKNYQVTMKRQERVGGTLQAAEEAVLSIRRQPKAVRIQWPSGSHQGREVIYASGDGDGLLHVNMGDSIVPVPPLAIAPDSAIALSNSRHPITEAGFDTIVEDIEKSMALPAPGTPPQGKVTYAGLENPGQLERPSHKIVRVTPAGETWTVYFDTETKLPVMVQATDAKGDLLERYLFGSPKVDLPELASSDAFNPDQRWGQTKGGLLQRLARVGGSKPASENATR